MNYLLLFYASLIGTSAMTIFMYALSYGTGYKTKVIKVLGTMLTFQTQPGGELSNRPSALVVGSLAHYAIGFGFTLVYGWLWHKQWLYPDLLSIFLLGGLSGLFAAAFWATFFKVHPNPPTVRLSAYLYAIFFAHFVFVWGVVSAYNLLR